MSNLQLQQTGRRQFAIGIVLAIVLGIVTPVLTVIEVSLLMPVILLNGLFMVFLYCYSGRMPSWLYMTIQLGAAAVLMGSTYMWTTMAAGVFPAILAMRGIMLKKPFFEQLKADIAFYLLGMLGAIIIAWTALGGNVIGRITGSLRDQFNLMPDDLFAPFVDALNRAIPSGISVPMTVSSYRERVMAVLELLGETYAQVLPGKLICGAALSGALTALWGNWLMARHGLAGKGSYIVLSRWFLPGQTVVGLLLMWLIAYLISATDYSSKTSVYIAVYDLVSAAFYIQAIGAVDRFLSRRGASGRKRHVLVVLTMILGLVLRIFNSILFVIGACSALFGSHGIVKRRPRNNDKNDIM